MMEEVEVEITEVKRTGTTSRDAAAAAATTTTTTAAATETPVIIKHEPLQDVPEEEEDDNKNNDDEDAKQKRDLERSLWTKVWQGLAAGSLATNIIAMVWHGSAVAIAMGIIACCVAPIVAIRQQQMQNTNTLRQLQNKLRHEVNRLQMENNTLTTNITELETKVAALKASEETLREITDQQGGNVDQLVTLVKENRDIINSMRAIVKTEALHSIFSIILASDLDQSYSISNDQEVQMLQLRLQTVSSRVELNATCLRTKMAAQGGTLSVTDLIQDIYNPDNNNTNQERIFILKEEENLPINK